MIWFDCVLDVIGVSVGFIVIMDALWCFGFMRTRGFGCFLWFCGWLVVFFAALDVCIWVPFDGGFGLCCLAARVGSL